MAHVHLDLNIPTDLPTNLPVMALRRGVLLPGGTGRFLVGRPRSLSAIEAAPDGYLLVASQRESIADPAPSDLLDTAVLARVVHRGATERRGERITLKGLRRVQLTGFGSIQPYLEARYDTIEASWPDTTEADGLAAAFRSEIDDSAEFFGEKIPTAALVGLPDALLADVVAALLRGDETWLKEVLCTTDPLKRMDRVLTQLVRGREARAARDSIKERVQNSTRDQQKEFFLRQQLKAIQDELGGNDGEDDLLTRLSERLDTTDLPDDVREVVDRELKRLTRINRQSPEKTVALDWLEWIADLPWNTSSAVDVDLAALEATLDSSHYGLDDVKRQVVEHLAVRRLAGAGRADVLLLLGPPGVGKTSIGQAIADATGRELVRVALGGMRDEAELRGHRRTYIGARPGRLVEGLRRAGTSDPVILLDEVDKLGRGAFGDPGSALLEILDPEQNHAFVDRYLEVPFDLSKALFVATANDLGAVPGPLRDRLQIIDIAGYTREEKIVIARTHLLPRVAKQTGLEESSVDLTDEALEAVIAGWTRESGVRELQRQLGKLYRAAAVLSARDGLTDPLHVDESDLPIYLKKRRFHDDPPELVARPGLATGLAWTPVGGTVLHVESSVLPGSGQLMLTGQLGDVMKESARAALTYVLSNHEALGVPTNALEHRDVHVHVPAGAVPKDGPSAGVTMATSIASLLGGRPVRSDTAMIGEATLRGRVLPVGGIKSKVLAAHRQGLKRVILPRRNSHDLDDIPEEAKRDLEFILVDHLDEVLHAALVPAEEAKRNAA